MQYDNLFNAGLFCVFGVVVLVLAVFSVIESILVSKGIISK